MELKNINEWVNEVKSFDSDFFTKVKKQLSKLKLSYYEDTYNNVWGAKSLALNDIIWENPYAIGNHSSNDHGYTDYSKKGSFGSKQLLALAKYLRKIRNDYKFDVGLYRNNGNWFVYSHEK